VDHSADSSNIVDRVASFVERFVFLKSKPMYLLVALWIIATHIHEDFEYMGYLFIRSPEKECGKTRLLEVLDVLVLNSSGIECSPTAAFLFRTAKGNTQLLDEADGWRDIDALQSVLNMGFQKHGQVTRCDPARSGGYTANKFPVYGPRAIAGIGERILGDTTRDRTFFVDMERQKSEERREKWRGRLTEAQAKEQWGEIAAWVGTNRDEIKAVYDRMINQPCPYLDGYRDRTVDVAEPLAAILEVAYRTDPEALQLARLNFAEAISLSRREESAYAGDHEVLRALKLVMDGSERLIEQPSILAQQCSAALGTDLAEWRVSEALRRYAFPQKSVRKEGQPRKCYVVERTALEDLLSRYAP
jgi:hypothetical protein